TRLGVAEVRSFGSYAAALDRKASAERMESLTKLSYSLGVLPPKILAAAASIRSARSRTRVALPSVHPVTYPTADGPASRPKCAATTYATDSATASQSPRCTPYSSGALASVGSKK